MHIGVGQYYIIIEEEENIFANYISIFRFIQVKKLVKRVKSQQR